MGPQAQSADYDLEVGICNLFSWSAVLITFLTIPCHFVGFASGVSPTLNGEGDGVGEPFLKFILKKLHFRFSTLFPYSTESSICGKMVPNVIDFLTLAVTGVG